MPYGECYVPTRSFRNVCFSGPLVINSDGTLIACAQGAFVTIINVSEPFKVRCFKATLDMDESDITALALTSYEKKKGIFYLRLLCASHERMIEWNLLTLKITGNFNIRIPDKYRVVSRISYCSSKLVVTVGRDGKVIVWRESGAQVYTGSIPEDFVVSGSLVYVTAGIIKIIDGHMVESLQNGASVTSFAGSSDGKTFITHDKGMILKVWSTQKGLVYPSIHCQEEISAVSLVYPHLSGWGGSIDFDLESDSVCFITAGTSLKFWACSPEIDDEKGGRFISQDIEVSLGLGEVIKSFKYVTFYSDSTAVMFITRSDELIFCDLAIQNSKIYLKVTDRLQGYISATHKVFFPGNQFLALADFRGDQVRVINVVSMACAHVVPLGGHGSSARCLDTCMTSDGTKLMVTGHADGKVRLWDVTMEVLRAVAEGHVKVVRAIAFTKGGESIVSCSDGYLRMWKIASGMQLHNSGCSGAESAKYTVRISSLVIDPSGRLICTGAMHNPSAHLWELSGASLRLCWTLEGQNGGISSIEFSTTELVITASTNNTFKVWDTRTGECIQQFDFGVHRYMDTNMYLRNGTYFVSINGEMSFNGETETIPVHFTSYIEDNLKLVSAVQSLCDGRGEEIRTLTMKDDTIATVGGDRITFWTEKLTIWRIWRGIEQMNDFVGAYLKRYPNRTYLGPIFYMPGMICVGRHDGLGICLSGQTWLFQGVRVRTSSVVKPADLVGSRVPRVADSFPLPSLDGVLFKNVGDIHKEPEFDEQGGLDGFTREEYTWCILKMDSGGIRPKLDSCLEWLVKNGYAHNHPVRGKSWHTVKIPSFQMALKHEFGFQMKFTLERVHGGEYILIEVKPEFDSNFCVTGPRKYRSPDMLEVQFVDGYPVLRKLRLSHRDIQGIDFSFMY